MFLRLTRLESWNHLLPKLGYVLHVFRLCILLSCSSFLLYMKLKLVQCKLLSQFEDINFVSWTWTFFLWVQFNSKAESNDSILCLGILLLTVSNCSSVQARKQTYSHNAWSKDLIIFILTLMCWWWHPLAWHQKLTHTIDDSSFKWTL